MATHPNQTVQVWAPRALAALLFLVGVALAFDHYVSVRRGLAARDWPTTIGDVTVQHGVSTTSRRFHFDYEVDGRDYRSWTAWYMPSPMYRPGRAFSSGRATVYYDPAAPGRGVLIPGVSWLGLAWSLLAPLALFVAGGWILKASSAADRPASRAPAKRHGPPTLPPKYVRSRR